jgi:two-component system sensor histidine kinase KdpD
MVNMLNQFTRTTPDEALKKASKRGKGTLKIFLGYAPGVGKTYTMLNEANRRFDRNENIVIGYLETHGRKDTEAQIGALEIIPRKQVTYNNVTFEEMDTDAIIARKPQLVIVDELAHTNVPGSKNSKRYTDVEEILNSGISVISTLNIQHLESLNDIIKSITGIIVKETIPDNIVDKAAEVSIVDITPDALQDRLKRGDVYTSENVDRALKHFFRKGNLSALREIALRHTAEGVDEELAEYMHEHGINENWQIVERVMICISSSPTARKLIRRGSRISKRYKCEWTVVAVNCTNIFEPKTTPKDEDILERHFKLAKQLGADVITLTGDSISGVLSKYAITKHITQIIIGHSSRTKFQTFLRGSTINKLLKRTYNIEVHIIPNE